MTGGDAKTGSKPARKSGMVIQLVAKDREFGWGGAPQPDSHGPSKETRKLPEGEDIKKEVWLQLGKVAGHTNVVPANLLQQYTPVAMVEEAQELEEREVTA